MSQPTPTLASNLVQNYLQAICSGAFARAGQLIQEAVGQGVTPAAIYDQVFAPSLREVGQRWETGQMTVAQEHLATGITEFCRTLLANQPVLPASNAPGSVLLTNVPGNQHTLGLNLLCDVFRWRNWQVYPLITPLPEEQIAQAVLLYRVDLLCLSVALPAQLPRVQTTVKTLRQQGWKGLVEVGGPAFVNNEEAFGLSGADFLGRDAQSTVETAERLLAQRRA